MTHDEMLEYVVKHPVKTYFKYKWGFKNNIAEHLTDLGDAMADVADGVCNMLRSLFWIVMCIIAVFAWPVAKAVLLLHLRKRIIKERPYMKATKPNDEYRI